MVTLVRTAAHSTIPSPEHAVLGHYQAMSSMVQPPVALIAATTGESIFAVLFMMFLSSAYFLKSWRRWRVAITLADTPSSPPSAVPFGRSESSGHVGAHPDLPPLGRLSPAAWYQVKLQRYESRGKRSTWVTRWTGTSTRPFRLYDASGFIEVYPDQAEVETQMITTRENSLDFPISTLAYAAGLEPTMVLPEKYREHARISDMPGSWRILEEVIPHGTEATVYGPVLPASGPNPARFAVDKSLGRRGRLIIVPGGEKDAESAMSKKARWGLLTGPLLFAFPSVYLVAAVTDFAYIIPLPFFALVLILALPLYLAVMIRSVIDIYNRVVAAVNQVESAWSMLDVSLVRRSSLFENLTPTLAAALEHEQELMRAVTQARWSSVSRVEVSSDRAAAAASTVLTPTLVALVESYPQLRTSENALALQEALARSENLIASARVGYNEAVAIANTRLDSFPASLLASRFADRRASFWSC
jgi:LemA protein